jgi:predicted CxxxxCH...CXXCH cytochrome family protein
VDGSQRTCGSCHKAPPDSHAIFPGAADCHACHPETVKADGTIDVAAGKHVDGTVQGPTGAACTLCHGAAPPDTGAHVAHATAADPAWVAYGSVAILEDVSPSGGASYFFGCGQCHPTDPAMHMDGTVEVDVAQRPAPASPSAGDLLKARNDPAAAFDEATGTCSGVYCHSSGQASPAPGPAYVETPAWNGPAGALGCGGCHGNPPKYPSGGPGSDTANSHLDLDVSQDPITYEWGPCWEFGHFAGLPGATHPSKHGGGDPATWPAGSKASPITCQTCHFDTVEPSHVRAGGFFYFDPDGDYDLRDDRPGPLCAERGTMPSWTSSQCKTCHAGELGSGGRARPLRHVNGKRDVAFDGRRSLPAGYETGIPPLADPDPDPTIDVRPYYVFDVSPSVARMAPAFDAAVRRTAGPTPGTFGPPVLTTTLESARYDPATKTCSSVACHIARQAQVDALTLPPLRWGEPYAPATNPCSSCHPM